MVFRLQRESETARVVTDLLLANQLEGNFDLRIEGHGSLQARLCLSPPDQQQENACAQYS